MTGIARLAGVLLAGAVAVGTTPAIATAQEQPENAAGYAPTMLVLDASGSMAEKAGGETKMAAAKTAVDTVVDSAPDGSTMGLAAYGTSTGSSDAEKSKGCQDTKVLHKPAELDRAALKKSVAKLKPRGYTPIGHALETAAKELPSEGPRSIVLVSDGEDSCAPPEPCEVVKKLSGQGVDLVIHSVGFDVDKKARQELDCIARTTGGTYTDAPDAKTLERKLPRVANTALRNYKPSGKPVSGTTEVFKAPTVRAGQYLDEIGPKEEKFYAVEAPEGSTLYYGATLTDPTRSEKYMSVQVSVYGKDGETCFDSDIDGDSTTDVVTAVASLDTTAEPDSEDCSGPGKYHFAVKRLSGGPAADVPVELLVGVEPKLAQTPATPPATTPVPFETPDGQPKSVTGGATFGTASTLDGAGVYSDQVYPGEFVFYRVKVGWGQSINVRTRYDNNGVENSGYVSTRSVLFNPYRKELHKEFDGYSGRAETLDPSEEAIPVNYRNRELDEDDAAAQSIAGWYYVGVKIGEAKTVGKGADKPVPVYLDVDLRGEAQPTPDYEPVAGSKAGNGDVFGDGGSAQAGNDAPARDDAAQADSSRGEQSDDAFPVAWVVGGSSAAAALLLGGLLVFFLLRRRRATPFQR